MTRSDARMVARVDLDDGARAAAIAALDELTAFLSGQRGSRSAFELRPYLERCVTRRAMTSGQARQIFDEMGADRMGLAMRVHVLPIIAVQTLRLDLVEDLAGSVVIKLICASHRETLCRIRYWIDNESWRLEIREAAQSKRVTSWNGSDAGSFARFRCARGRDIPVSEDRLRSLLRDAIALGQSAVRI